MMQYLSIVIFESMFSQLSACENISFPPEKLAVIFTTF